MHTLQFSPQSARKLRKSLLKWYQPDLRRLPWRILWNKHRSPYHVWVSEIMLQQTTIKAVLAVYEPFFKHFPTVKDLAKADEEDVRLAVRGLGYYRRFSMLHRAAKEIMVSLGGKFPETFEGWLELPGIGEYTASAVSSITLNTPHAVVDGNVERVLCRLFDIRLAVNDRQMKPHYKRWAAQLLDVERPGDFNQAMMELGQLVCRPIDPDCDLCPVATSCLAKEGGTQELSPGPKLKTAKKNIEMQLTIFRRGKMIGIHKRPKADRFLKDTWGFLTDMEAKEKVSAAKKVGAIRHNITHHDIKANVWIKDTAPPKNLEMRWLALKDVEEKLVSNLDRKALRLFEKSLSKS